MVRARVYIPGYGAGEVEIIEKFGDDGVRPPKPAPNSEIVVIVRTDYEPGSALYLRGRLEAGIP